MPSDAGFDVAVVSGEPNTAPGRAGNTKAASYETARVMMPGKARNAPREALCALSLPFMMCI
jgi:hypothetical protein